MIKHKLIISKFLYTQKSSNIEKESADLMDFNALKLHIRLMTHLKTNNKLRRSAKKTVRPAMKNSSAFKAIFSIVKVKNLHPTITPMTSL